VQHETIQSDSDLEAFCQRLADQPVIVFDTEFVSEDRYRPELCLLQVAAGDLLAVIDPFLLATTQPFWDLISTPGRVVVAHAAREEIRFCHQFTGLPIAGLYDIQLSAGFVGIEYPASLGTVVQRLPGKTLPKGESRTNWRTRPLHDDQIHYALQDVTELEEMYTKLHRMTSEAGREGWLAEEVAALQQSVIDAEARENWRRVSGSSGLNPRQLEIVRHLWRWREARAKQTDRPPRRVLRDDLIVELARRQASQVDRIRNVRGMERRNLQPFYGEIAAAVQDALQVDDKDLPKRPRRSRRPVSPMLSQFLSTSIACVSRQHHISPAIVGNSDDVRELLAYELDQQDRGPLPKLLQGWRGEVIGQSFRELLSGQLAIRIADLAADQPLEFIRSADSAS